MVPLIEPKVTGKEDIMRLFALMIMAALFLGFDPASAAEAPTGTVVLKTTKGFDRLVADLDRAVEAAGMGVVARASASAGAAARGVTIPGNMVVMVFRNDIAVRMLAASVPAGIEAPLRFYVTENTDGSASLTYRAPSSVFHSYGSAAIDQLAAELDPIFERIGQTAAH